MLRLLTKKVSKLDFFEGEKFFVGDRFSSLGDIPFDWHFTFGEGRPLRIVPFGQSKYDAPSGIEELEREKKKGEFDF